LRIATFLGEEAMSNKKNGPLLYPLLTESSELYKEYLKRRTEYYKKSVKPNRQKAYEEEGWTFEKKLKTKVRLKKFKPRDEQLENKFWCLLYRVGYKDMNLGRNFKIKYKMLDGNWDEKQIDIFAKDDETVIVVECKSATELKRKSLQKELAAFANAKGGMADSIKKFYGRTFKPKILWLFITENIIWSGPDKDRASAERIKIITEREFNYFNQIANHLGPASKYQFLATFFEGEKIPELKDKIVPAVRGKLGGKYFYSFVTTPKQLLKIAFINHRALDDPEGYPTYQRMIQKKRIKDIGEFIEKGGFFPTNFLVNFTEKVRFDISRKDDANDIHYGYLYLPDQYKSAWIIDGQHRLYGFSWLREHFLKQNIMVLAFEKLPREEEANQFLTINHEQKSVPRNLLDDLEGDLKWGSDNPTERIGAISARLIQKLDGDIGGPLYDRVTAQGIKPTERTCLTVPEIKDGIRRSGLVGKAVLKMRQYEPGPLSEEDDYKTLDRAKAGLTQYFSIIRQADPERWEKGRSGYLCINPGIRAYMALFAELIAHMESKTKLDAKELTVEQLIKETKDYLKPILAFISDANNKDFETSFKVPYGSGGPKQYLFRLCQLVRQYDPEFSIEGYNDWEQSQSQEQIELADKRVKELTIAIREYIFDIFKQLYGEKNDAYWEQGVTNKEMKTNAYRKRLDDPPERQQPLEVYLEMIELMKIVENRKHWHLFKDVFNIVIPNEKKQSKNLRWMERLNQLRRIPSHAAKQRVYTKEDFEFLGWLHPEFMKRMELKNIEA
jgi:DNA sulfur modification protein DndB